MKKVNYKKRLDETLTYIELAQQECNKQAKIYRQCEATDTWPGLDEDIELLEPPKWQMPELDLSTGDE